MRLHRHTWTVKEKNEQPSGMELLAGSEAIEFETKRGNPEGFFVRPVIVHYACSRCPAEKVERV